MLPLILLLIPIAFTLSLIAAVSIALVRSEIARTSHVAMSDRVNAIGISRRINGSTSRV